MEINFKDKTAQSQLSAIGTVILGAVAAILGVGFFPGFLLACFIAYFKYLNTGQLWGTTILGSIIILIIYFKVWKNWKAGLKKYIITAGIIGFVIFMAYLFVGKNFVTRNISRLFKKDHIYVAETDRYNSLTPGEKEIWLKELKTSYNTLIAKRSQDELVSKLKAKWQRDDEAESVNMKATVMQFGDKTDWTRHNRDSVKNGRIRIETLDKISKFYQPNFSENYNELYKAYTLLDSLNGDY